jgi:hypothetical protein
MDRGRTLLGEGYVGPGPNDALSPWRIGDMKRRRPVKKLLLSSETLLCLNQIRFVQGGGLAGTLTFEGTCENSLCPDCTALCTGVDTQ